MILVLFLIKCFNFQQLISIQKKKILKRKNSILLDFMIKNKEKGKFMEKLNIKRNLYNIFKINIKKSNSKLKTKNTVIKLVLKNTNFCFHKDIKTYNLFLKNKL